ncbi:hypothetical protein A5699_18500 [Mycobacterium sp. E802]|uniref:hypothetical protein n=1 Tax=Mycobacterium sp. E802 TaxID=1834152 RepID=UPI0008018BCD|nr:hypothetical protein [Mycobacterium sp. E802]OBG87862.1 hypothetical protein A5699_18500 [Mycobacterium sp. E802]
MTSTTPAWNTPYGQKPHRQLPTAMFNLAAEHARRAIEGTQGGDTSALGKMDQLASIGAAAELLVKSTLAGIDVSLLAGNANTPTLLALIGRPSASGGKVFTVGGTDAVRRLNECKPQGSKPIADPKLIFEVRNEALHMGLAAVDVTVQDALTELVALADSVFEIRRALHQDADWDAFWSPKHLKIVQARQQAGYEKLRQHFDGLLDAARTAYARLTAGLDADSRIRLIAELVMRAPEVGDAQMLRSHACPACQNTLWVVYDVVRDVELDDSDAPNSFGFFVKQSAYVASASCPVCSLALSKSDMMLTDIPFVLDLGDEEATPDEIEGWGDAPHDEDRWAGYEPSPDDFEEPDDL